MAHLDCLFNSSSRCGFFRKAVVFALVSVMAVPTHFGAFAATHALTSVVNVNTIDYVVNVDWDFDNPPVQVDNPSQVLDRAYINSVMRVVAKSVFTMTEGRHRLGNVYVYRNKQFGNNVNIQLINTRGRSSAHVAGFNSRNSSSFNHLSFGTTHESVEKFGKVIAHELGHYTYGLLDEYVEAGTALDPNDPGAPSGSDNPKNTIMNDQNSFVSLSTPADYADPSTRQTAQARVMSTGAGLSSGSAWETLTRTPDQDPDGARSLKRTFFEAFRGINAATLQLTRPTAGFDRALNLVFAPNPQFRDVIVVDRTLPAERFAHLIQAAKALVGQAKSDTQFAIVASPGTAAAGGASNTVLGYTESTLEGKQALGAALDALQPARTANFDGLSSFTEAYRLLAAVRKPGDMATLHVLTGAEAQLPIEAATSARLAKVSVNPLGLMGGTPAISGQRRAQALAQSAAAKVVGLSQLAEMTGGSFNLGKNGSDAAKDVVRANNETHSSSYAVLSADESPVLNARATFNSSFNVASAAIDGEVDANLYFDPKDAAKLKFSLVAPSGTIYSGSNTAAGITFTTDAEYGQATFVIAADAQMRTGKWTVRSEALAQLVDGIGLEVSSDSLITLSGELEGGRMGDAAPMSLRAKLGGEKSIKGAVVTADIYNSQGTLVMSGVTLKDDGVKPDARAGDGQYAVSLAGLLPAGDYTAVLTAVTNASSRIASLGALVKGARDEELPVELISRVSEFGFALEVGATGVLSAATTPAPAPLAMGSSGGGCSVNPQGNDASLLLLLLVALLAGALRGRRSSRGT